MKQNIWILFLLGGFILGLGCSENTVDQTYGRNFTIEYDHQEDCDINYLARNSATSAFNAANTTLEFKFNDTLLPCYISEADLRLYYFYHVQRDSTGMGTKYPGYLCSILAIQDSITGEMIDTLAGKSTLGQGYSFVCYEVTSFESYLSKTAIHELGHQRGSLSHLCLNANTMNPAHNDSSCVMGQGQTATCTGKDLIWEPHFCPICRNTIKNVSW